MIETLGRGRRSAMGRKRHGAEQIIAKLGAELTATAVREWLARVGVTSLFIEPGSPWENGYIESFNGKLRDELLYRELFYTLAEAQILTEWWRQECNHLPPHSALGYRPPAPEAIAPLPLRLSSVALPEMPTLTEELDNRGRVNRA
jgi:transposase InsO family protein